MAVPFSRLQSEAIDSYGTKEAFDELCRYDGIVYWLGKSGAIQYETGGQPNFRERIMYGLNTNVGFRGKNAAVPQTDDDGFTLVSVYQALITGAIVYNQQELDQVRGNPAIAVGLIQDKTKQFKTTWVQTIAVALRQASPAAGVDPLTVLGASGEANCILLPTAPASQTAVTGGIARSETTSLPDGTVVRYWANQYSNSSMDLTSTAGRQSLYLNVYSKCVRGNGANYEPDFGLCGEAAWASLQASGDANRRYVADEKTLEYGFDNIRFSRATLIVDRSSRFSGKIAFLNSNALKLKVLEGSGGATKEMVDEGNNLKGVPLFWKHKDMSDYTSLRRNWLAYCTMNLVPTSLQDHGLADNIS